MTMWSPESPEGTNWTGGGIQPARVLYEYDGPTIFTCRFGFLDAIFLKVDELPDRNLFLAASTTDRVVDAVIKGALSVRAAFIQDRYWIVETDHSLYVRRYWEFEKEDLPEDFLPDRHVALYAHLGRAPDTIEQATSFFAMAFDGDQMDRSGMPFSWFKGLVTSAHDAARRLLSPIYLSGTRSVTFDFRIAEPVFGSLVLAIKDPVINEEAARRRMPDEYKKGEQISAGSHFAEQRDYFFEEMEEVVKQARRGSVSAAVADERYELLDTVQPIIPTSENGLDYVEFTGRAKNSLLSLNLNYETGDRIQAAYRRSDGNVKDVTGVIDIINAPSFYFVIRTPSGRQINCSLEADAFSALNRDPRFRQGSRILVRGPLYRRPRRDWLRVQSHPQLL